MEILIKLGNRIRHLRIEKGLSQEKLAEKSGLHRTYVGAIERGERNITIGNLERLSKALDIPLLELFRFE